VRNAEFTQVLASVLRRPAFFHVPSFVARLAFGEMADELVLSSERVEPAKLRDSGYAFRFAELRLALEDLVG
jgi:NAD dependent epimerase/dehydratase family enzyme